MNRREMLLSSAALGLWPGASRSAPMPPMTPRRPLRIEQLGRVRIDDYAWLKDPNWKAVWRDPSRLNPAIRAHLALENAYADAVLAPTLPLQRELLAEMRVRTATDDPPPPVRDGPWLYGQRVMSGARRPAYVRSPADGGAEQVLLDVDARATGRAFFAVRGATHSPDHRLFAWAEDDIGSENFRIQVKDLDTGDLAAGPAEHAFGDFAFSPDSAWLFWTWRDANSRPAKVFRRPAQGGPDVLVYEERDPAFLVQVTRPASNTCVMIRAWNAESSEVWLIPAAEPTAPPRVVEPRTPGLLYSVEPWNGALVILTNADGAIDFKLMRTDPTTPARANWRTWVAYRPGRFIIEMRAYEDYFVRRERVEANPGVVVTDRDGHERTLHFGEPAYAVDLVDGAGFDSGSLRLLYRSPRTPPRWLDYDVASGQSRVVRETNLADFDPGRYVVERLFAAAPDGASVPITVLRRRDMAFDGAAPLLLTGYGSYGYAMEADFSAPNLSLVDRGWVWAIAHVRGGSEKGWGWFLAARRNTKTISFTDFIACADHLVGKRYTKAGRIVTHGFSAGGLLVGAALNMRPDLWAGVVGQAPFVDMLNTMSDATHPLVPLARPDWGDPLADPAAYDTIASYSPYDNVTAQPYPPVLATTAVADDRVGYWEPAKWIAKLRALSTSGRPMLLHTAMTGGHAGGAEPQDELARDALFFAFAIWTLNLAPHPKP
jgi:oligopeptidase B